MEKFTVYTDGGARGNPGSAGAGAVIFDESGSVVKEVSKYLDTATNNRAEYEAVALGLEELKKIVGSAKTKEVEVQVKMDSELVVKQLSGEYQIKEESLCPHFIKIWNMRVKYFPNISFTYVPRERNKKADELANEAMDKV